MDGEDTLPGVLFDNTRDAYPHTIRDKRSYPLLLGFTHLTVPTATITHSHLVESVCSPTDDKVDGSPFFSSSPSLF